MANDDLLAALNEVLAMEYSAIIQYAQHHFLVRGHERMQFGNFFATNSQEAHLHAINLGDAIARNALAGFGDGTPGAGRLHPSVGLGSKSSIAAVLAGRHHPSRTTTRRRIGTAYR